MARPFSIIVPYMDTLEIARALIKAGADVNAKKDDGWTPLHELPNGTPGA